MNPRVTAPMRKAARSTLLDQPVTTFDDLIERLCTAILTADDDKQRYAVATQDPHGNTLLYGPYATKDAAIKAVDSGNCAHTPNTKAMLMPLIPSPRSARKGKK